MAAEPYDERARDWYAYESFGMLLETSRYLDAGLGVLDLPGQPSRIELLAPVAASSTLTLSPEMLVLSDAEEQADANSLAARWWRLIKLRQLGGRHVDEHTSLHSDAKGRYGELAGSLVRNARRLAVDINSRGLHSLDIARRHVHQRLPVAVDDREDGLLEALGKQVTSTLPQGGLRSYSAAYTEPLRNAWLAPRHGKNLAVYDTGRTSSRSPQMLPRLPGLTGLEEARAAAMEQLRRRVSANLNWLREYSDPPDDRRDALNWGGVRGYSQGFAFDSGDTLDAQVNGEAHSMIFLAVDSAEVLRVIADEVAEDPPKRSRAERLAGRHRLTRLGRGRF